MYKTVLSFVEVLFTKSKYFSSYFLFLLYLWRAYAVDSLINQAVNDDVPKTYY